MQSEGLDRTRPFFFRNFHDVFHDVLDASERLFGTVRIPIASDHNDFALDEWFLKPSTF
jgi:hypothetical protein